ncbi:hypothetical protein D7V91_07970 [bacterium 1xD42-67]|nr:hypothetical protein D7V91_07970 [bacterium 1xD42-67]
MQKKFSSLGLALCMAVTMVSAAAAVPAVTVEQIPPAGTAYAASQTVSIDGKPVTFQMYALRNASGFGTNYVKLRDLAYALNGTAAQFEVEYDGSIRVIPGQAYTPAGGEMTTPFTGDRIYTGGPLPLRVGSGDTVMTAIALLDANGLGYTYFKLRDLGTVLGFGVGWDDAAKQVTLDTGSGSGGSDAQALSDEALLQLAKDLVEQASCVDARIINADFVEIDGSGKVIGCTTVAQVEEAAWQYWFSIYSHQIPFERSEGANSISSQFTEKNGEVYFENLLGIGSGPLLEVERLTSRTATEAVFASHIEWFDGEIEPFELILVLEDGGWRVLKCSYLTGD